MVFYWDVPGQADFEYRKNLEKEGKKKNNFDALNISDERLYTYPDI